ncbi:MAG TPA: hypothetical protein VEJ67_14635 [Candidatus Cybelea sp.]|nr:hypothetical protein [Candidatus Cybelea sp.]
MSQGAPRAWASRTASAALLAASLVPAASAQSATAPFNSRIVEHATTISGGVCTNPIVGFSYRLPSNMKPQDANAMRAAARVGSETQWIGPEARYILYGYEETKTIAMLCGASSDTGQVQIIATPVSALESEGLSAGEESLRAAAEKMGQQLGADPSPARKETINGHDFERADGAASFGPADKNMDLHGSFYAARVNAYIVMWNLIGYSQKQWNDLVPTMTSVKFFPPRLSARNAGVSASRQGATPLAADFRARLNDFLQAWLEARDQAETLAFLDPAAYAAPAVIGTYCDGWYRKDASAAEARDAIASNLMGVAADFPKNSELSAVFGALDRLPPEWLDAAANHVAADHFLAVALDRDTLRRMFTGSLARSNYELFLETQTGEGSSYWVVFPERRPNGDVFVVFTLWQKKQAAWKITHIDVVCQ